MSKDDRQPCLVITGASRGIGLATAECFLANGYRVLNLSRSPATNPAIETLEVDLTETSAIAEVSERLCATLEGARSIALVHNAALQTHGGVDQLEAEELRRVLELNVVAPSALNHLLIPLMKPGSSIVYIGSTMSLKATARVAAYVTSKHALLGLMRSTCQDLGEQGIHTSCICPGFTDTEMLRSYGGEMLAKLASASTMGRLVAPAEVAKAVYFSASNPASNGAVIRVDLGLREA